MIIDQKTLAFIGLTGIFIMCLGFVGWIFYGISASGIWSEKVMSNSQIKVNFRMAVVCTIAGILMIIFALIA